MHSQKFHLDPEEDVKKSVSYLATKKILSFTTNMYIYKYFCRHTHKSPLHTASYSSHGSMGTAP